MCCFFLLRQCQRHERQRHDNKNVSSSLTFFEYMDEDYTRNTDTKLFYLKVCLYWAFFQEIPSLKIARHFQARMHAQCFNMQ